jgi:RNAse (barnase) inhibitor barstar
VNAESSPTPETIHLDFSGITSEREVHDLFASSLHFPSFYGQNWDAFWDVLVGFDCFPRRLVLSGSEHLRSTVPRAFEKLQSCFAQCEREYPDIAPVVTWT